MMQPAALLVPVLLLAAATARTEPRLERREGYLVLAGLPPILSEPDVAERLTTGLTATFAFLLDRPSRRGLPAPGARVEIRYALWEEVFEVQTLTADGRLETHTLTSDGELEGWWDDLSLAVLDDRDRGLAARELRLRLDLVPFSRSEQIATQRWFADAVRRSQGTAEPGTSRSPEDAEDGLASTLAHLLSAAIERRAVRSWTFELAVPEGEPR